jgi:hypothetical protein
MPMLGKIPKPNYKLREDLKVGYMQSVIGEDLRLKMFGMGEDQEKREGEDQEKP